MVYVVFMLSFYKECEKTLTADFQFAPDGCARASLVFLWVLRTLIGSIAQNLHKLKIRLRFYHIINSTLHYIFTSFASSAPSMNAFTFPSVTSAMFESAVVVRNA